VEVTEVGRNHKLDFLVHKPYGIVENAVHTFRRQVGSDLIRVSSDRVTLAPPASGITAARETVPLDDR
jgi:hypothetical protein